MYFWSHVAACSYFSLAMSTCANMRFTSGSSFIKAARVNQYSACKSWLVRQ